MVCLHQNISTPSRSPRFSSSRIKKILKKETYSPYRIAKHSSDFIGGVLEFISFEVLDLAVNNAVVCNKTTISPLNIRLAIHGDSELNDLFGRVAYSELNIESYDKYILIVIGELYPSFRISSIGMKLLNTFLNDIVKCIMIEAHHICTTVRGKRTLQIRDMSDSIGMLFTGRIRDTAIWEGTRCVLYKRLQQKIRF